MEGYTAIFYMCPKIHKGMIKYQGTLTVSSIDFPTEKINLSTLLDLVLYT